MNNKNTSSRAGCVVEKLVCREQRSKAHLEAIASPWCSRPAKMDQCISERCLSTLCSHWSLHAGQHRSPLDLFPTSKSNPLRFTSGHTYILVFNKEVMHASRKSMSSATSLQILICIVREWERAGLIIIAHTQNNMPQCSGACFHNRAINSDQCFRTNSNDDDSYYQTHESPDYSLLCEQSMPICGRRLISDPLEEEEGRSFARTPLEFTPKFCLVNLFHLHQLIQYPQRKHKFFTDSSCRRITLVTGDVFVWSLWQQTLVRVYMMSLLNTNPFTSMLCLYQQMF